MSVPAVQEKLNPYLLESPKKVASQLHCKEICFKLLSRICFVALVAIFGAALAISLGLLVPSTAAALAIFGSVLLTPLILPLGLRFQTKSIECKQKSEIEKLVAEKLKEIEGWDLARIQQFFEEKELSQEHLPREALAKLDAEPLRALLPLIAREIAYEESAAALSDQINRAFNAEYPDRFFARATRNQVYFEKETKCLPKQLNAALMLQLIEHPFRQERSIEELGTIEWRYLDERMFARLNDLPPDPYFVAKEGGGCHNLTLPQAVLPPQWMRPILFNG